MRKHLCWQFIPAPEVFTVRHILLSFLKAWFGLWLDEKRKEGKKKKKKKELFHPAPKQSLDLHVEVLMGVRCAPNQMNMAGNV